MSADKPRYLFHGTSRRLAGEFLQPSLRIGDAGDPDFPVVFASDRLDFASIFAVKNEHVSHISAGATPYVMVCDREAYRRGPEGGAVVVTDGGDFTAVTIGGAGTGKWYSAQPVPVVADRVIPIAGLAHLLALGVAVLYLDGPRDWSRATKVGAALEAPGPGRDFLATLTGLVGTGDLDGFDLHSPASSPARALDDLGRAGGSGRDVLIHRFFDDFVSIRMPFHVRVRSIHGIDHACRTAILCRVLHCLLVSAGVIEPFSTRDLVALMVAAFFHDVGRQWDHGPDDSVPASADAAFGQLTALGFSTEEAKLGRGRVRGAGASRDAPLESGAAILHSADAIELMRNYVGDIRLAATPVYRLVRSAGSEAVEVYAGLARSYARWLRSIGAWGLGAGRVLGPDGRVEDTSPGPVFDPIGLFRRSLSVRPFSEIRRLLEGVPELDARARWAPGACGPPQGPDKSAIGSVDGTKGSAAF